MSGALDTDDLRLDRLGGECLLFGVDDLLKPVSGRLRLSTSPHNLLSIE
ncbi:hypothetical protein [Halopenitus persicus]|uniref:Uncharacterized protein n=1 Tax=Halopenitus persicus TaxID=1048396 RepID=A0A1H3JU83_9EURY|nr:hypothetical protein [Halopenitus persicus]SDY42908.1 hypothetical protein SAMN05216564_105128 [Halopenitus persicus]